MARIRTIKPEFFLNEELASLSPFDRLLFIGLWTQADREGRLEDRPKRLKACLFPYDDYDIETGLLALAEHKFIVRYANNGSNLLFIQINNFTKHQYPHIKEKASTIPAPCKHRSCTPVLRKGREGKGTVICNLFKKEEEFENFWKLYPPRNGKKLLKEDAKAFFLKEIKDEDIPLILQAVGNYAVSKTATGGFAKDAIRFLRKEFWRDWVEPEKVQTAQLCVFDHKTPCYKDCPTCDYAKKK